MNTDKTILHLRPHHFLCIPNYRGHGYSSRFDEKMKAVVSVTFDNCFVVHDIKIIDGQDRLFIAMPSRKTPDNEYKDIAHPINMETRELLQSRILEKYQSTLLEE